MARKERDRAEANLSDESKYYVDIIAGSLERTIKRLWITTIILIAIIAALVTERIWLQSQITTETIEQEITQDAELGNNSVAIAGGGNITYGSCDTND